MRRRHKGAEARRNIFACAKRTFPRFPDDYIEIPDSPDFSVATTGQLTVSAWIRPDVLTFPIWAKHRLRSLDGQG